MCMRHRAVVLLVRMTVRWPPPFREPALAPNPQHCACSPPQHLSLPDPTPPAAIKALSIQHCACHAQRCACSPQQPFSSPFLTPHPTPPATINALTLRISLPLTRHPRTSKPTHSHMHTSARTAYVSCTATAVCTCWCVGVPRVNPNRLAPHLRWSPGPFIHGTRTAPVPPQEVPVLDRQGTSTTPVGPRHPHTHPATPCCPQTRGSFREAPNSCSVYLRLPPSTSVYLRRKFQ